MFNILLLFVLVITQVLGDVCLSQAMKLYGEVTSFSPAAVFAVIYYLLTSIWFYMGLGSLTVSWFIYLFAVSKMDLSYVLPIHASSYVINALLAWLLLGEIITPLRWFATLLISVGVFIVGYSEYLRRKSLLAANKSSSLLPLFLLFIPTNFFSPFWLGVIVMVLADSCGDLLNAKGMRLITPPASFSLAEISRWLLQIATNFYVIVAVLCQALALFLFISLLSWDDLSLVRPASALGYLVTILAAKYLLGERVSRLRWFGITLIVAGVMILSVS
ncbi:MAG: EamA family transporter [Geminocystis sp.]|nr:EamA family transporter [Geminocystis sp.]HIK36826.1 EamA family transporter [Geminocystis sp. M7585_C2015_104]MCS7148731.1 EamA family transporter [Geminocystis sp.]MCX8078395.1 EamA family transporter [Geminocystis sp.]MDW8116120.1 EamA family transporter [Geminocystis sp.]